MRTIFYVIWGDKPEYRAMLERSKTSVEKLVPGSAVEVLEGDPALGLLNKPRLLWDRLKKAGTKDEFLFLDCDTTVMGNLEFGFRAARQSGMACCICECPWLRRYGNEYGDEVEYNSGVIFFNSNASDVFRAWDWMSHEPQPRSRFSWGSDECGLECDDQFSFSRAIGENDFPLFTLPLNYNFRPLFHTRMFAPLKVWHSPHEAPAMLGTMGREIERGERPVTFGTLRNSF
jgi:hypothetical protein